MTRPKKPESVRYNKVAKFQPNDAEQMIVHWRQLADLHKQRGNHQEVNRLQRLADQMQGIVAVGLPTQTHIKTIELKPSHPKHD